MTVTTWPMLRLWRAVNDGHIDWRASLEDPLTGDRHGFASLARLMAFLEARTATERERDAGEEGETEQTYPD